MSNLYYDDKNGVVVFNHSGVDIETQKYVNLYKETFPIGQLLIDFIELDLTNVKNMVKELYELPIPQSDSDLEKTYHQLKKYESYIASMHPYFLTNPEDDVSLRYYRHFTENHQVEQVKKNIPEIDKVIDEIDSSYKDSISIKEKDDLTTKKKRAELVKNVSLMLIDTMSELTIENRRKIVNGILFSYEIHINDAIDKQKTFSEALLYCLDIEKPVELTKLTPTQRYYLYSKYINTTFEENIARIQFGIEPQVMENSNKSINDLNLSEIADIVSGSSYNLFEIYDCFTYSSLCYIELIKMISNNIQIKKCNYCGKYFINNRYKNATYCNRIPKGETKPCYILGPRKNYEAKLKNDPLSLEYRKAYKTRNARVRSQKWTNNQFEQWSREAKEKLLDAQKGLIDFNEFVKWLKN